MTHFVNPEMNPDWADQEVSTTGDNAYIGGDGEASFIANIDRHIRFDWMHVPKRQKPVKPLKAGEHIRVKAREKTEEEKTGREKFLELCKKMNLNPSTNNKK